MLATIFAWAGIIIATGVLALLLLPFRLCARGVVDDSQGLDYHLEMRWALGLFAVKMMTGVRPHLYFACLRIWRFSSQPEGKKKAPKKSAKKKPSPLAWIGWTRNNFSRVMHVLHTVLRASFIRGSLKGEIGLSDPADTAFIGLLCQPIQIPGERFNLDIGTVYEHEIVNIRAKIQSTLIIGYLGWVALGLLLEKQTRAMLRGLPQI